MIVAAFSNSVLGGQFRTRRVVDLEGTLHSRQPSNSLSLLPTITALTYTSTRALSFFLPVISQYPQHKSNNKDPPCYSYTKPYPQCLHQHANLDMSMSEGKKHDQTHHVPLRSSQSKYVLSLMLLSIVSTRIVIVLLCFLMLTMHSRSDNLSLAISTINPSHPTD